MKKKVIKSVDRVLQVLELYSLEKPEWGVTEIAKTLNIYKSNVHIILTTLSERGFIKKDSKTDKYKLGIKFFELGSIVIKNMNLRKITHPYIEELSKEFGETVHLGILDEGRVVSIEREESDKSLCSHVEIGKRTSLHCTAVGKAIMAYLPKDKFTEIIKEKSLIRYTENTITNKKELEKELEKIRKQGYAIDNMENEEGVRCVASPIRNYKEEVIASLSISGPAFRINENNISIISKKVKECCNHISEEMGYKYIK